MRTDQEEGQGRVVPEDLQLHGGAGPQAQARVRSPREGELVGAEGSSKNPCRLSVSFGVTWKDFYIAYLADVLGGRDMSESSSGRLRS